MIESGYLTLIDELRVEKPGVRGILQQYTGDYYLAFMAFCSLPITNQGEEIEYIEIEIGCRRESDGLSIGSDITYSNGYVLSDGPQERRARVDDSIQACLTFVRSSKDSLIPLLD